jgi:hypothetical protein
LLLWPSWRDMISCMLNHCRGGLVGRKVWVGDIVASHAAGAKGLDLVHTVSSLGILMLCWQLDLGRVRG